MGVLSAAMNAPVRRGLVYGLGKDMRGGVATFFMGEVFEATLVRPIHDNSSSWWVEFDGDKDASGDQVRRCRTLLKEIV